LSGYQVGKVDFLALLDSQRTVYDYELEYNRVLTDGQRALARLQAETGLPNL
jgi:outer membrane protein TolC